MLRAAKFLLDAHEAIFGVLPRDLANEVLVGEHGLVEELAFGELVRLVVVFERIVVAAGVVANLRPIRRVPGRGRNSHP